VLGTLQRNQGLLGDVETRATQVAPYLRNLLALSTALQQKYAAGSLESDPALRMLFVSDIHGAAQYDLMRTIVEEESIDAVIDTGDLVNFGTVEEASAAGLFAGIESLGVPYLFVRGNHDATSATDTGLLRRMEQVPNVVLLEPPDGGYTAVSVGGVTIAGFNDPRWFGDSGTGSPAKQVPAREAFVAAFANRAVPDVVASHEPWALDGVEAGIRLNGHMHSRDLEGNRIQTGTFTGGGPFNHFVEDGAGEELVGQPSSFDILTFGTDCRLSSLTRYQMQDVVEGRPTYDDVSILNGARIDTREANPDGRTCSPDLGLSTAVVDPVSP
jgi:predicted MPP superfamily phosphohydrolase